MATFTSVRRTIFAAGYPLGNYLPVILRSYVAVADEASARRLERYFKSGSGKAFAKKRFLQKTG